MADPAKLAFSSPTFNAYKEYGRVSVTVSISGTATSGSSTSFSGTGDLRRLNAVTFGLLNTSATSDFHTAGRNYGYLPAMYIQHSDGSTATFPGTASYIILLTTEFLGETVTVRAFIGNPFAETLTLVPETLTLTFYTVIAPFKIV